MRSDQQPVGDYLPLRPIADRLNCPQAELVAMAARGEFAPVLKLSARRFVVRRCDLEAWERRSEVSPASEAALRSHLDDSEAMPFAGRKS